MNGFHVAGDILDTTLTEVEVAVRSAVDSGAFVDRNADEISLSSSDFELNIYRYRTTEPSRSQFLVGGELRASRDKVLEFLCRVANALKQRGIVFRFELYEG